MGVEKLEMDTVTLRLVARTLPGKQFAAGRQLRVLVIRALTGAGIITPADAQAAVGVMAHPATVSGAADAPAGAEQQR